MAQRLYSRSLLVVWVALPAMLSVLTACFIDLTPVDEYRIADAEPTPDAGADARSDVTAMRSVTATPPTNGRSKATAPASNPTVAAGARATLPEDDAGSKTIEPPLLITDASVSMAATPSSTSRPAAASLAYEIETETMGDAPMINIRRPANLVGASTPLPVVVWDGCVPTDDVWTALLGRWASAGFVVLSLHAPSDDPSPLDLTTMATPSALLDAVFELSERTPYKGKLDLRHIVLAGCSCGGSNALQVAAHDSRVTAVFVLSGASGGATSDASIMAAIGVPVGYVVGGPDDVTASYVAADVSATCDGSVYFESQNILQPNKWMKMYVPIGHSRVLPPADRLIVQQFIRIKALLHRTEPRPSFAELLGPILSSPILQET